MKRLFLACTLIALALAAAWYGFPHWFKEPLVAANRAAAGLAEKQVTVDAHRIHYLDGGSGETLVLLHGIFAEKDHWVDFARPLTGSYRVLVPDLPGFGESSRLDSHSYTYDAQTERLKALLDTLGVTRAHLAGNSMGGTIAALFAIRYPERVASVALIGAPHGIRSPKASGMDRQIEAGKSPLVTRDAREFEAMLSLVFAERPFLPYPILHAAQENAVRNADSNLRLWHAQLKDRFLLDGQIGGLGARTLVLWGSSDQVFDASGAEVLKKRLKNAEVHVLPGIGHLPMMEAPKETAGMYARFLARQAAAAH
ncbi:alpha/beta fold hydrolase [Noviherbaspirillum sp.]|uniref:alpha/beta fold hydrolase n=1 Tax=Noviherbaspirillum sp. TaxID=1926288 RepID=UPI002D23E903|nr:alpha/beta fold hydrolase [Noviherbaspirillum sp.]HZW19691.1 alpha/beta fold hydrolase [Noviherbaspirillum sp.]